MLCILAIRLLLAYPPGSDLGSVADPELKLQLRQQSLEPARVPTGFHPHAHQLSLCRQITVELLRFLTVLQSLLSTISRFRIHKRNLLEARVVIASYNDHCPAPFYPSLLVGCHHQSLLGPGSRRCYGINSTHNRVLSFAWACGPPMGMKKRLLRFTDSKLVEKQRRQSAIALSA